MRAAALALLLLACASRPPVPRPYPGALIPSGEIRGEFMMRQRVAAHYPGRELSFDAVLQKQGDTLTLVGITPFGSRAFVMQQRGTEVTFTSSLPMELPFPPRYMLQDIHRTFFVSLGRPPAPTGERVEARDGEEVRETWRDGRLIARTYRRLDGAPAGLIEVDYGEGMIGRAPPRVIRFRNGWYGYALTITTLAHQTLSAQRVE